MQLLAIASTFYALGCPPAAPAAPPSEPVEGVEDREVQKLKLLAEQFQFRIVASAQLDIIHDFNAIGLDPTQSAPREFITALIPVGGAAAALTNRTTFSPNQSQLKLRAQRPTRFGLARAQVQFDLTKDIWGTEFRLYRVWGGLGYLRFGLDYTPFLNKSAIPDTLDFEGPQTLPETRTVQASLRFPVARIGNSKKKNLLFEIGLESAPAEITMPHSPNQTRDFTNSGKVPATVGKFILNTKQFNLEIAGAYRRLSATGNGYASSTNGWGLNASGLLRLGKQDNIMLGFVGGSGIAAYMNDLTGLGMDAAPISYSDPNSPIKAIGVLGAWGAYQHFWHDDFRSTATLSYLETSTGFVDNRFADSGPNSTFYQGDQGIYRWTVYSSANLIWSPFSWFEAGVEYIFGYRRIKAGSARENWENDGHDSRVQVSIRIEFDYSR